MSTAGNDARNLKRGIRNGLILSVLFLWLPIIAIIVGIANVIAAF